MWGAITGLAGSLLGGGAASGAGGALTSIAGQALQGMMGGGKGGMKSAARPPMQSLAEAMDEMKGSSSSRPKQMSAEEELESERAMLADAGFGDGGEG